MQPYLGHIVLYALVAVAMPGGIVYLALVLTKRLRTGQRSARVSSDTYESGMVPIGEAWIQYRAQYYLYGPILMCCVLGSLFRFPWAGVVRHVGAYGPL